MKTIKDVIISRYNKRMEGQDLSPNSHILFDIICEYIQEFNFKYQGRLKEIFHADLPHNDQGYTVNCFSVSYLMDNLAREIGIDAKKCSTFVIKNFACRFNANTDYPIQAFDSANLQDRSGDYQFDQHCIAIIDDYCFDITLLTKYEFLHDGIDVLGVFYAAIKSRDFQTFDVFFKMAKAYGVNINTGPDNWGLLHYACAMNRYDFVEFLLKNNADAYRKTSCELQITPLEMLHNSLKIKGLNFSQKGKILACLKLQSEMELKNQAANSIQAVFRGHSARKAPTI